MCPAQGGARSKIALLRTGSLFGGGLFGLGLRSLFLGIRQHGFDHASPLALRLCGLGLLLFALLARVPVSRVAHGTLHLGIMLTCSGANRSTRCRNGPTAGVARRGGCPSE